ncbi:restriction endonuclease subunit S [Microbacterium sp. NPDC060132]|uniref:restriction endonuclease subunit S n=1 Tax=unclassified Microbacterium TaxID=2609290 RepID=UPI00365D13B1
MTWTTESLASRTLNLDSRRVPVRSVDRVAGPYPYYGASGVVDYVDDYLFDGLHLLVAEDGENLRSRKTPIAFLADGRFWVNNHAHILRGNEANDTRFLSYALEATDVNGFLSGSTQPKLTQRALAMIPVTAPDLAEQVGIASALGALDGRIAANSRVVKVAADVLDAEIGLIEPTLPLVPLGELCTTVRSTVVPRSLGSDIVDHFSLPAFDSGARPDRVAGESIMSAKVQLTEPTVLVSRLNPRFNRTWWAIPAAGVPAVASTEFSCLIANADSSQHQLWLSVRSGAFIDELPRRVTGTSGSHQRVRPADVLSIAVPDTREISDEIRLRAESTLALIHSRRQENAELIRVRESLIPDLLEGVVRVPESQGLQA